MSLSFSSLDIAKAIRRFNSRRCAFSLWTAFSLVAFVLFLLSGNSFRTFAQSKATANPTATPRATQSPSPRDGASAKPASITGMINGRVVSDDGRPVVNATVIALAGSSSVTPRMTRVDNDGQFVFGDLAAAAYLISATAPGYIDQTWSQGDSSSLPRHLIGSELKITMIKGGVITGTITNSMGEPVVGVAVRATPVNDPSLSRRYLRELGTVAESDDRGIYRIYGLLPGQYTVTAGGAGQFGQFTTSGFDLDVPTFYPSSTRDAAVPVTVRSGSETTDIDITYRGMKGHSISGFVTGAVETGTALGAVTLGLSHAGSASVLTMTFAGNTGQRREFNFTAIADGDYDLFASFQPRQNDNPLFAAKHVTVRGGDLTGVELNLAALASITGTIALDPIKPEDKCDRRASEPIEIVINTPRDEPRKSGNPVLPQLFAGTGGMFDAKGEFTVPNLEASKYRLGIALPTDAWYIRAIIPPGASPPKAGQSAAAPSRTGGDWHGVIALKSGERFGPVRIVVGQDAASLSGRISTPPETAIPVGLRVHLVPEEPERVDNILRYSESIVRRDGSFSFMNLAPGRYFVITRIEPLIEATSIPLRPIAWDPAARTKLWREAKAANQVVELKPCQRLVDYTVALFGVR